MRIFLDANILFSASNERSNFHRLIHTLNEYGTVVTSPHVCEEALKNLERKRPVWAHSFHDLLKSVTLVANHALKENIVLDAKDRPILGAAIAAGCDYLLTGDKKDFKHLFNKTIGGVTIVDTLTLANKLQYM